MKTGKNKYKNHGVNFAKAGRESMGNDAPTIPKMHATPAVADDNNVTYQQGLPEKCLSGNARRFIGDFWHSTFGTALKTYFT